MMTLQGLSLGATRHIPAPQWCFCCVLLTVGLAVVVVCCGVCHFFVRGCHGSVFVVRLGQSMGDLPFS